MFISAVEKGDYELASKYFVLKRQIEWKDNLMEVNTKMLNGWVDSLKTQTKNNTGYYSNDQRIYTIEKPAFTQLKPLIPPISGK